MSFEKIPYDKNKLEAIRIRLENHSRAGNPIGYAVSIDGMEIIPRTNDATLFESIYELLDDKTRSLTISEYVGETRNRNTTCFYFNSVPTTSLPGTLQGIDPTQLQESFEERVQKQVEAVTLKKDYDKSQRENQTLKQQLTAVLEKSDQQEDRIKKLEEENEELKKLTDEKSQNNMILQLGREALERWLGPKKPDGPLSGTPEQPQQQEQNAQEKTDASTHIAVPENEYNDYKFFSTLIQKFDPVQRGLVSQLVTHLSEHPELIEETFMNAFYKNQTPHGNEEN